MKITIDTKNNVVKAGGKPFNELDNWKKTQVETELRNFLKNNTKMSSYEEDCMWMSYRYCIGRHTIASHGMAGDIGHNCYKRMSDERSIFTAYDINKEIEDCLRFKGVEFRFPITSLNRIYTSAVDIFCEFLEDYGIDSVEQYLNYKTVEVILTDNERGYKLEVVTWEEWLRPRVHEVMKELFNNDAMSEDYAWEYFQKWENNEVVAPDEACAKFKELIKGRQNKDYFFMHDIEDLFVWNDLVHLFDVEHHHKSVLVDGTECEWFWTWTERSERREDGFYYKAFGYKKIRVPVDKWNGLVTTWIPDESIKEDLY